MLRECSTAWRRSSGGRSTRRCRPICAGCRREGEPLCATCLPALTDGLGRPGGVPLGLPADLPAPLLQLEWCAAFVGPVRAALHGLKYGGERRLVGPLADALAERWRNVGAGGDMIVPVPVHATRRRERGFDQAELLADAAATRLGLPAAAILVRERATVAQFGLAREARASNVAGAFRLAEPLRRGALRDRWPILVDDVVTTGATLVACAEVLLDAGAVGVSAVTVAREG